MEGTRAATGDNSPPICGLNTGQHIYLDAGEFTSNQAKISFSLTGATERKWNILVSMIECSSPRCPPRGCLQYFTGTTGTITTYNYNSGGGVLLTNQDYSICLRSISQILTAILTLIRQV